MPITATQNVVYEFKESTVNMVDFVGVVVFSCTINGSKAPDVVIRMEQADLVSIYTVPASTAPTRAADLAQAYYNWAISGGHLQGVVS